MATREDYEKRLMSAAVRVVRSEDGYTISASSSHRTQQHDLR